MVRGLHKVPNYKELSPRLFERFINIKIEEDALIKFAKKYGPLGGNTSSHVQVPYEVWNQYRHPLSPTFRDDNSRRLVKAPGFVTGESFDVWKYEIEYMCVAIELWEAIHELNGSGLEKYIQWTGDAFSIKYPEGRVIAWPSWTFALPEEDVDLVAVARTWLMEIITSHLGDRTKADFSRRELKLDIKPTSLIGALWLQLARDIENQAYFPKCVICGKFFKTNRRDAKTCPQKRKPACGREKTRRDKRQKELLRLVRETPGASWEDRLELWEDWREKDRELLRIKTADALKDAYETAKTQPGYALKF